MNASADDWRQRAACRDTDPRIFFPTGTGPAARLDTDDAKAVCRTCWVQDHCLQYALDTRQDHGTWAGRDESELRRIRRRTRAA